MQSRRGRHPASRAVPPSQENTSIVGAPLGVDSRRNESSHAPPTTAPRHAGGIPSSASVGVTSASLAPAGSAVSPPQPDEIDSPRTSPMIVARMKHRCAMSVPRENRGTRPPSEARPDRCHFPDARLLTIASSLPLVAAYSRGAARGSPLRGHPAARSRRRARLAVIPPLAQTGKVCCSKAAHASRDGRGVFG
jgi:hypothetical protein